MARSKKQKSTEGNALKVQVTIDVNDNAYVYYTNHLEVGHSAHEFCLNAARVPTKFSYAKLQEISETSKAVVEAAAQLLIPPTVIPSLIRALKIQQEKYEEQFGRIKDGGVENE